MTPAPVLQAKIETCKCKDSYKNVTNLIKYLHTYVYRHKNTHIHLPKTIVNYSVCLFFFSLCALLFTPFFSRRQFAGQIDASGIFSLNYSVEKYITIFVPETGSDVCKRWLFVDIRLFCRCRNTTSHFQFPKIRGSTNGMQSHCTMMAIADDSIKSFK